MYRIKEGFMLREVSGSFCVVAVGKASKEFKGVITLNEVGAFLFKELQIGIEFEDLVKKLLEEYDVTEDKARLDIAKFIESLKAGKLLQE